MSLVEPLLIHNYHVLSYNSRGVGGSTGWSSFTGFKEGEDLKAISKWAIENFPDVRSLVILVYSLLDCVATFLKAFRILGLFLWFSDRISTPDPSFRSNITYTLILPSWSKELADPLQLVIL
jgi:alpha/beta superfamily hydrolase